MRARLVLAGDVALGGVLVLLAWWLSGGPVLLVAGPAIAAALAYRRPAWALGLVWASGVLQVVAGTVVLPAWIALPFVAFRVARHGSRTTVLAAAVSVPLGAVGAVVLALARTDVFRDAGLLTGVVHASGTGVAGALLALVAVNAAPLALGLAVRVGEDYRRAEARASAEHELAQARAAQSRLAYDVHDIVGHSLAVIIAQADAAHAAAEDAEVRASLARIAAAGRTSLAEVRAVLSRDQDASPPATSPELDELVRGVRDGGTEVTDQVSGTPVALDDATAGAAYRVLQELLTNSLKHGAPGGPVEVERVWAPNGLTLRVSNPVGPSPADGGGMGLVGLRTRVDALGGSLRTGTSRDRFVATAYLPAGAR